MAKWHGFSRRKPSGGRLKRPNRYRGKRKTEIASEEQLAFVGDTDSVSYTHLTLPTNREV